MPTYGSSSIGQYCDPFYGCYSAKVHNYLDRGNFVGGVFSASDRKLDEH